MVIFKLIILINKLLLENIKFYQAPTTILILIMDT